MSYLPLNGVWAALEARVAAHDPVQLDPSAVVPTSFASLPEREVEDDDWPKHRHDMHDALAWAFSGRGSGSIGITSAAQRHEWLHEYATAPIGGTVEDLAGRPSSRR